MPCWQFVAIISIVFNAMILIPRFSFFVRLAQAVWLDRIPESLLFPPGVAAEAITSEVRPIQRHLLVFRIALLGLLFPGYAALGCPGRIGYSLTPADLRPWNVRDGTSPGYRPDGFLFRCGPCPSPSASYHASFT
jgi:hypothetical protein